MYSFRFEGALVSSVAACLLALASCSSSTASTPGGGEGAAASTVDPSGGATGAAAGGAVAPTTGGVGAAPPVTGGTGGAASGAGGTTGTAGTANLGDGSLSITECEGAMGFELSLVQSLPECTLCAGARCAPNSLVPPEQIELLAPCDADNTCVPEGYAVTGGSFLAKSCASLEYAPGMPAEGRCISVCVPAVAEQLERLPQADCTLSERCAPCWDPIDGVETGACGTGCDPWTAGAPQAFTSCGMGRGICVPPELIPPELLAAVPPDTCTGGWLCAPIEKARDINYVFPSCCPALEGLGLGPDCNQPGACVPNYIAANNPQGDLLGQSDCQAGEKCAPCTNPLDGTDTGACN